MMVDDGDETDDRGGVIRTAGSTQQVKKKEMMAKTMLQLAGTLERIGETARAQKCYLDTMVP